MPRAPLDDQMSFPAVISTYQIPLSSFNLVGPIALAIWTLIRSRYAIHSGYTSAWIQFGLESKLRSLAVVSARERYSSVECISLGIDLVHDFGAIKLQSCLKSHRIEAHIVNL